MRTGFKNVALVFCLLSGLFLVGVAEAQMPGGWSRARGIDQKARSIFNRAVADLVGVKYTPLNYRTQVVNGTNYRFYCNTLTMGNPRRSGKAYLTVHVDLEGKIRNVSTEDVGSRGQTGSAPGSSYRSSPGSSYPGSSYPGSAPGSYRRRR